MLIRISLIIAILAALAVGALNFVKVKEKIETLKTERDDWHGKFTKTDEDLTRTKGELDKTAKDLKQTKETLEATTAEKEKAVAEAAAQLAKANELTAKLTTTTEQRDVAQQELQRYKVTGFSPEQILAFGKQIKTAQEALEVANEEKKILSRKLASLQTKYDALTKEDYHGPPLPASLAGKIIVSDPKWEFVVLDVGLEQGVLINGELLVNRNGKLVAKVRILSVQKDRSIANVMPGWKLGEVMEGDQVIAAYPAS
jgi:hypothetical protein